MPRTTRFVGRYQTYPGSDATRLAEGGKRLHGEFGVSNPGFPLVSIITVCWNSAATIEQTIRSVKNQSYPNIEHIIVDGGSTDTTINILKKYDEAISYWVSEADKGLYFAMNKGLELAHGEYILILNSDDWYVPHCVESLLSAKEESGADFVSGLANYVDLNGKFIRQQPSFPYDAGLYLRMPLRHETMLISRALYDTHGPYDTRYFINADRALTTRFFEAGITHYELSKPLMFFRDTGVSSTDMTKLYGERERMISRYFPGMDADDITVLGRLHLLKPQRLESIARQYNKPNFSRAAWAYGVDRKARGTAEWQGFDFSKLEKMASVSTRQERFALRNIATLTTSDHGGAGIGSQRRVEALRKAGLNAEIYCLFRKTSIAHVDKLLPSVPGAVRMPESDLRRVWRARAVVTREDAPDMTAMEMVSKAGSVVDFRENRYVFDQSDIVHLHWVVGMFDYENAGEVFGDKPVVWTLADMNAFTGGCHYSEGCEGYKFECKDCPLLGASKQLAHETWEKKKAAYAKIKNLHIICPSQWLADCAKASSLLGDRPVHVIPNAFPVDRFKPTNKLVARQKLGLPLDKKLVLFGADSLTNRRKGGDLLAESINHLRGSKQADAVEGVFFGAATLELGIRGHNMGHVADEQKLSLIYAAADVFAFPSREDNAPLTVAESLLSGTPVVAFPVGNVPEMIQHKETGYIAKYEDCKEFADGLVWALNGDSADDARLRGLRGNLHASSYNNPETAAARHIALYNTLGLFTEI